MSIPAGHAQHQAVESTCNLTRERRVVIERKDTSPHPGHAIVIFKRIGGGMMFRRVVMRSKTFRWGLLGSGTRYAAYGVSLDPNLQIQFASRVDLEDLIHSINVDFRVGYEVSSPQIVVERLESDPLGRLQDHIQEVIGRELASNSWQRIIDDFDSVRREVLNARGHAMNEVRRLAEDMGIRIKAVNLVIHLLEADADVLRTPEKEQYRTAALKAELERSVVQAQFKRWQGLLDDLSTAISAVNSKIVTQAGDPEELSRKVQSLSNLYEQFHRTLIEGPAQSGRLGEGHRAFNPLNSASTAKSNTQIMLFEAIDVVNLSACTSSEKDGLLSAVLHIFGEALLGELANQQKLREYSKTFVETISAVRVMTPKEVETLCGLCSLERIKGAIHSSFA